MRMQIQMLLAAATFTLAFGPGASAQDNFPTPPNSLALEDTGTLEAMQGNVVKFRDSKNEAWLLTVVGQTTMQIEGQADENYLRPGLTIELTGEVNEKNELSEPIKELSVVEGKGRPSLGLFPPEGDDTKPVRNPEAGKYKIRGRVATFKDDELMLAAGRWKIAGKTDAELKVKLSLDDPRSAKFGDSMTVKAWYYDNQKPNPTFGRPGHAVAEEIKITLTNPPATLKRSRTISRPAKPAAGDAKTAK
jgi:hypothetical protein